MRSIFKFFLVFALGTMACGCAKNSDIGHLKERINGLDTLNSKDLDKIQERLDSLNSNISDIEIISVAYIPKYSDGKAVMPYTYNNCIFTAGSAVFDFEFSPASAAAELADLWNSSTGSDVLKMKAVYTITKAVPETVDLAIESATAEGCYLTVTVSGSALKEEFFNSECSANASLKISYGKNNLTTAYVEMVPMEIIIFSDANFKDYCVKNFDMDGDGEISSDEALSVTRIECINRGLTSLAGIEYFSNLESIDVSGNSLTSVELSHSPKLKEVLVNNNKIQLLNLGGLSALETLDCSGNELSDLDVSASPDLKTLRCSSNALTSLDVSTNTALVSLDVSNNSALVSLNYKEGLEITTGFSVGHYINVNGDPGVAFYISGTVTKIVSTDETSANWENGKTWCTNKGSVWYMPSYDELREIYNKKATLDQVLDFIGATRFSLTDYWSSSLDNKDRPRLIDFGNGGGYSSNQPSKIYRVRAVRAL